MRSPRFQNDELMKFQNELTTVLFAARPHEFPTNVHDLLNEITMVLFSARPHEFHMNVHDLLQGVIGNRIPSLGEPCSWQTCPSSGGSDASGLGGGAPTPPGTVLHVGQGIVNREY